MTEMEWPNGTYNDRTLFVVPGTDLVIMKIAYPDEAEIQCWDMSKEEFLCGVDMDLFAEVEQQSAPCFKKDHCIVAF